MRSCDIISCHVTAASCELQPCRSSYASKTPAISLLQPLPVDFRPNNATSGLLPVTWRHVRSFCHMIATSCELQLCRSSNVHKTRVFGLVQPFAGDIRWNDVPFGTLPVTWTHITSFLVTWLPPPASYSPVGAQLYPKPEFSTFHSPFQLTSGEMTSLRVTSGHFRSRNIISCHETATSCEL